MKAVLAVEEGGRHQESQQPAQIAVRAFHVVVNGGRRRLGRDGGRECHAVSVSQPTVGGYREEPPLAPR
jgi:hypothetical protein